MSETQASVSQIPCKHHAIFWKQCLSSRVYSVTCHSLPRPGALTWSCGRSGYLRSTDSCRDDCLLRPLSGFSRRLESTCLFPLHSKKILTPKISWHTRKQCAKVILGAGRMFVKEISLLSLSLSPSLPPFSPSFLSPPPPHLSPSCLFLK